MRWVFLGWHFFKKTIVTFETTSTFSNRKISCTTKNGILKNNCHIWKQLPRICLTAKFGAKIKFLSLESKMLDLGVLGSSSEKLFVIFEINALELVSLQSLVEKQKSLNLGPKMSYGISGLKFKNSIVIFEINVLGFFSLSIFFERMKILKFRTKSTLFGYFWAGILKNCCHIWNQRPWMYLDAKLFDRIKMPRFGTKNALFRYFGARILKSYCHICSTALRCRYFSEKTLEKALVPSW